MINVECILIAEILLAAILFYYVIEDAFRAP